MSICLHATAVAVLGRAVLLTGPPGSGKSDLALRLIDRGALLVADDQVELAADASGLLASAPAALRGLLEVRGLGIIRMPFVSQSRVLLLADLSRLPDRMPAPDHAIIAGIRLPRIAIAPFEASAPLKLERAMALAQLSALWSADETD